MRERPAKLLAKADRSVSAARRELAASEAEFAAGHAYYARFYAAEALLAERDLDVSGEFVAVARAYLERAE